MFKLNMRRFVSLLLALCMVTLPFCADIAFAVEDGGGGAVVDDSKLTATLYNTGNEAGTGVALTTDGLVSGEGSDRLSHTIPLGPNMLVIRWNFSRNQSHTLKITVPMGMYIVENSWTLPNQQGSYLTDVSFTPLDLDPNAAGLQQGTGTHANRYTNAKTGTLTYTTFYDENATTDKDETIKLMVEIDEQLWDKNYSLDTAKPVNGSANAIEIVQDEGSLQRIMSDIRTDEQAAAGFSAMSSASTGSTIISPSPLPQTPVNFVLSTSKSEARDWAYERVEVTYAVTYKIEDVPYSVPVTGAVLPNAARRSGTEFNSETKTFTIHNYSYESVAQPSFGLPQFTLNEEMGIPGNTLVKVAADIVLTSYNGSVRTAKREFNLTYKDGGWALEFIHESKVIAPDEWYGSHTEIVDSIGAISFRNSGTDTTDDLVVEVLFDKDYTAGEPRLLVSVYRLPLMKNKTASVTIDYAEEIDGVWENKQTIKQIKNVSAYDTYGAMVSLGEGKYITRICYSMEGLPGDTYLYRSGSLVRDESGGSIHGRLKGNAGDVATTQMTVSKANGEKIGSQTCTTTVAELESVEYVGYFDPISDVSAEAGSDTSLNLTLSAYDFGFSQSTFVPSPVIFFVAPKGVSVSGASFSRNKSAAKTGVDPQNIVSLALPNGDVIYRVSLGEAASFGGFFVPGENATKIGFVDNKFTYVDLALKLDANMSMSYYGLRDRLYLTTAIPTTDPVQFSGYGQWRANQGGVVKKYHIEYNYAVEEGGTETTRHFASFELGVDPELRVSPLTNGITYTPAISEYGANNWRIGTSASNALYLYPSEAFQYRIVAKNNSGSAVPQQNTALYIPVPHKDGKLPDDMGGAQIGNFEVRLTGPVAVSGETASAWDIRYSLDATAANFSNGAANFENNDGAYATWYTAEEIENDPELHWEDVICIKAGISEDYLNDEGSCAYPIGATDSFLATMEMMAGKVGQTVTYASAIWNQYNSGGEVVSGGVLNNTLFAKIILENGVLDHTDDASIREQMAVKTYDGGQSVSFPDMKNFSPVNFSITNVSVVGFDLVRSSEIIESSGLAVTAKDRTFGITLQLNGNAAVDLANFAGEDLLLGVSNDYGKNTVSLQLSHYDTIIDATSERYVDVTLEDENESIKLIYRIDLLRKLNLGAAKTSIVEGAYYNGGAADEQAATSATITVDGVVTAQFIFDASYIPNQYEVPKFVFGEAFPEPEVSSGNTEETKFTLIDMSKKQSDQTYVPKYYYYVAEGGETEISLTEFVDMEDRTTKFAKPDSNEIYALNYVLIIDFDDRYNKTAANYSIRMDVQPIEGALVPGTALNIVTKNERYDFHGTASTDGGTEGSGNNLYYKTTLRNDQFSFDLTLIPRNLHHGNSQLWSSRREQLKISFSGNGGVFPKGSYLTDEDNNVYTPGPDGTYVLIPIANVMETRNMSLTFHSPYTKITNEGVLSVGYMSSSSYLQVFATIGGWTNSTLRIRYTVANTPAYALQVDRESHLITAGTATAAFTVDRTDGASDLAWSIYPKEGEAYSAVSAAEGISNSAADQGTVEVNTGSLAAGTYRVVFTAQSGTKSYFSLIVLPS